MDLTEAKWRKSTHSGGSEGNCVEIATNLPGIVALRDSKNPTGPALIFTADDWRIFLSRLMDTSS
jgi:hypothetical protein